MLGLLLFIVPVLFVGVAVWKYWFPEYYFLGIVPAPVKLTKINWLYLLGITAAIEGWLVSGYITLRNSIKQHTINTLLQSRLSTQYMSQASVINKTFFAPGMPKDEPVALDVVLKNPAEDVLPAVNYVLNYFEFLAVGLRHGDLDNRVLRQTMRGIVLRMCKRMSLYISYTRDEDERGQPRQPTTQFEHIKWLLEHWADA